MAEQVYVEIVAFKGHEVVSRMGPMSEWKAKKVEAGALINNNHEKYFIRTVPANG